MWLLGSLYSAVMALWYEISVLLWFKSYLSDIAHRVKCNTRLSSWQSVKDGIPQGSALSLTHPWSCWLKLLNQWATDSRMESSQQLRMWFKTFKWSQRNYPPIVVDAIVLNIVTNQRYLGLVFDQNLSWYQYVSHICKKSLIIYTLLAVNAYVISSKFLKL